MFSSQQFPTALHFCRNLTKIPLGLFKLIGFCQNWFENHFLKFISLLMQSSVENWRSQSAAYPMQTFCSRRPSWSGWWPMTLPVRWPRAEGGERATPNPHSPTCCWTQELVETCQRAAPISVPQSDGLIFSAPCSTWAKDAAQDLMSISTRLLASGRPGAAAVARPMWTAFWTFGRAARVSSASTFVSQHHPLRGLHQGGGHDRGHWLDLIFL